MELESIAMPIVTAVASVAGSYGLFRGEVAAMQKRLDKLEEAHGDLREKTMYKSDCEKQHTRTDRDFAEMKNDLKEIKALLQEWVFTHGGKAR